MLTRQSALRVAAASVSAVFISVGAVTPVYADGHGGNEKAQAASSHANSQGNQSAKAQSQSHRESDDESQSASHGESAQARQGKRSSEKTSTESKSEAQAKGDEHDESAQQGPAKSRGVKATSSSSAKTSADKKPGTSHSSRGNGHTPVTVCHLLGNGGYHLLTFDEHALKAHLAHGDVYPTDGTCPTSSPSSTGGTSTTTDTTENTTETTQVTTTTEASQKAPIVAAELARVPARVLGVEAARSPRVLGVEAVRAGSATTSTSGAPAQVAPATGLLPNTGATRIALPLVAGFGLLAAGVGLLLRRRGEARG